MRAAFTLALALLSSLPSAARAQEHDEHTSPYAGLEGRAIKALSDEDVQGLLAGEGMGYALAAELNGYPGPRHVLELADSLGLTVQQRERTEAVRAAMSAEARRLGALLVEAERSLDGAFGQGAVTAAALAGALREIGALEGELRRVHLQAHLEITEILTEHQRHRYQELRGYAATHSHGAGG